MTVTVEDEDIGSAVVTMPGYIPVKLCTICI